VSATFDDVVGQSEAIDALRAALPRPVHAYLLVGPEGCGKEVAADAFAAALVCPNGGCGSCRNCELAAKGRHPDIVHSTRSGATISVEDLRNAATLAQRRPLEAARQVLIIEDFHLATRSAPALLKTLEEPPATTVFLLLADDVPPELVTVASRCVEVAFPPLSSTEIAAALASDGVDATTAREVARASAGNLDRGRLLVKDPSFGERLALWRSVPTALDGNGDVAVIVRQLLDATDAALAPLKERHAEDLAAREAASEAAGERSMPGRKEFLDRQARLERRYRGEELRAGLSMLQRTYGDLLAESLDGDPESVAEAKACGQAIDLITSSMASMKHNPNETLHFEALLIALRRCKVRV
jgi:DNA polymerase-3 subunit delta'